MVTTILYYEEFTKEVAMVSEESRKGRILKYKVLYTILILIVYLIGRNIPLYGIDLSMYTGNAIDAQTLLIRTVSGDRNRISLFALGISPYMMSSIIVQIFVTCLNSSAKSRISPGKINRITMKLMIVFAMIQSVQRAGRLQYIYQGRELFLTQIITIIEMITGVMMILQLSERNKKYGIGGQTAIIYVNILDGLISTLKGHTILELIFPGMVSLVVMVIVVFMENTEKRIPLQRISIHNIYADKNYLAIKLNPIGMMPVMFATSAFMIPQILVDAAIHFLPENSVLLWWQSHLNLNEPAGIFVYIGILYILTITFSFAFINPGDMTEQFLKSGDSIVDLHAGRETKRYLVREVRRISFLSTTVMGICLGIPMYIQSIEGVESSLVMLPASIMMLTGIFCNLYQEIIAVGNYDAYQSFI